MSFELLFHVARDKHLMQYRATCPFTRKIIIQLQCIAHP